MNEVIELLKSHRSIRKFTNQTVSDELVNEIVACGQSAATSNNIQATTVIRVRDPLKREKFAALANHQEHVTKAPVFLIYCADLHRPKLACEMAGGEFQGGQMEQFIIATVDVALAAQNSVVAAESLGLGSCYIGALRNNPQVVTELLELPPQVYPVFGLCLGYPDQNPEVKPRMPLQTVLKEEIYQQPDDLEGIKSYDKTLRGYYRSRSGGTKESSWSEEVKGMLSKVLRPHMRDFLAGRGFDMK